MNNLNSILIEGEISVEPVQHSEKENICVFTITSNRFFKYETGIEKEVSHFNIQAWDKLCEECLKKGKAGTEIRAVGRLKQIPDSERILIVAEHIEYRPKIKHSAKKGDNEE